MPLQHLLMIVLLLFLNSFLCKSERYLKFEEKIVDHTSDLKERLLVRNVWKQAIRDRKSDKVFSVFIANSWQYSTDAKFLSLTIDSGEVRRNFSGFSFGSKQLQTLARGLSPCCLRLGGTNADFLTFDPEGSSSQHDEYNGKNTAFAIHDHLPTSRGNGDINKDLYNFTLSGNLWKSMTGFFQAVGWDLIFDFNLFKWRNGYWDPSNAKLLLDFSDAMGYDIAGFQLGNEPNSFHYNFNFSIDPPVLVKDFRILRNLISQFPRYRNSPLFGPDVTDLFRHSSSRKYLYGFVEAGGGDLVKEISLHQYYMNGRTATVEDFYNVTVLDFLRREIDIALQASQTLPKPLPIRFTETSSCYGGGAQGLSDAYVAGFMWLDKLGLSANYGVTKVFRQTFYSGKYSLLSSDALPNPDYFLSLLHKRLILGPVFNVTVQPTNELLRIYAHCTRTDFYKFPQGSQTLSYLNVAKEDQTISLSQYRGQTFQLYSLTPGDENGLKSRFVKLNGDLLKMDGDQLPALQPKLIQGDIILPALTFGFIVIPGANIPDCKQHKTSA